MSSREPGTSPAKPHPRSRRRAAMAVAACAISSLCATHQSLAGATTFSTTATDFLNPANWSNGLPGPNDEAVLAQAGNPTVSYTGGNLTLGAITLPLTGTANFKVLANLASDNTVSTLTLNGVPGKATINLSGLNTSGNGFTIQGINPSTTNTGTLAVMLANDADFRVTESGSQMVISADIGETNLGKGLTLLGYGTVAGPATGTITLSGNNSFTGPVNLRGGNLNLHYTQRNSSKIGSILNIGGATLNLVAGPLITSQNITTTNLVGGTAIAINTGTQGGVSTLALGSISRGPGSTLQTKLVFGSGQIGGITTTTGNGPEGFLGGWAVTAPVGAQNPTDWAMNDGGNIVQFNNYVSQDDPALWNAGDNVSSDVNGINGTLSTQTIGSLRVIGATGNTPGASTINITGRLTISSGGYLGASTGGTVTFSGGEITSGTSELMMTMLRPVIINSAIVDNAAGSVGITKTGTPGTVGDLNIPGSQSFSGDIHINMGSLSAGVIANTGQASSLGTTGTVYIGHGSDIGTLNFSGTTASTNRSFVLGETGGAIRNVNTGTLIFDASSQITGGGLLRFGVGAWTSIVGPKTYSGEVTVAAGTLGVDSIANAGSPSGLGTGTFDPRIVLGNGGNGGTLNYSGTVDASTDRPFVVVGTNAGNGIRVENGGTPVTLTLTGGISGTTALTKAGSGTLIITGANNWSGTLTIAKGALSTNSIANIGSPSGLGTANAPTAGTITIGNSNTGTLSYTGTNGTTNRPMTISPQIGQFGAIESTTGSLTLTGGIDTNNKALAFDGGGTVSVNSAIIGAGSLNKNGAGTLLLNGTNTYTGNTTIQSGTVVMAGANAWAPAINGPGITNINHGRLVLDYTGGSTPGGMVQSLLATSFAGGFATGQLRSVSADSRHGLGWSDDGTSRVSVAFTYYGDANLDGVVDTSDFTLLSQHFNTAGTWQVGDFNYDGKVNALDFNAIASNFGATPISPAPELGSLVPEPATLALTGLILPLRRRRK